MSEWSGAESIAATLLVMFSVGGVVAGIAIAGADALDWIEERLSKGDDDMLATKEPDHVYHGTIRPKQEADYSEWLDQARNAITKLSLSRESGIVSADDVWDICPPPPSVEPRAMGAVWQPRDRWQKVGIQKRIAERIGRAA